MNAKTSIKKVGIVIPIVLFVWTNWLIFLGPNNAFSYIIDYFQISLTMIFGSMIAGGTSIGGGAIAFPVFTKILHIPPHDAKVFSLAIQGIGMTAASLTILLTQIKIEWRIILWGSLGGGIGIYLGTVFFAPLLPPQFIKMSFTAMATSFAIVLFIQHKKKKPYHLSLPIWTIRERAILLIAGFLGGIMSGLVGNGIDIFLFAIMVLLFRMNEKVATFTSVILMAINALLGFAIHVFLLQDFSETVRSYWLAAIPIVVVGAPIGAMICSFLSQKRIVKILVSLIFIELITSLLLIPLEWMITSTFLIILIVFFYLSYWLSQKHY
jgi:uncharacterized protein